MRKAPDRTIACLIALLGGVFALLAGLEFRGVHVTESSARAADPVSAPLTDDRIITAMKKGVDFLLNAKKSDNWESGKPYTQNGQQGGETCLALLTLLHVGQSLQDESDYGSKLNWHGKELAPVVDWVARLEAEETYTAAFQAAALAYLPRKPDEKPGAGPQAALQRAYRYLIAAMGVQGGYTYGPPGTGRGRAFDDIWAAYYKLKSTNRDQRAIAAAKGQLDAFVRSLQNSFGGPEFQVQRLIDDLREAARTSGAGGGGGAAAQAQIAELTRYAAGMPQRTTIDYPAAVNRARQNFDDVQRRQRTGDIAGLRGVTIDDLPRRAEDARLALDRAIFEANNHFSPIGDLSNAQYGALGVWSVADSGIEVRQDYWQVTDRFWRLLQGADGGWSYLARPPGTGETSKSMTVAGLATLLLIQEQIDKTIRTQNKADKNIEMGLAWLNRNFRPDSGDFYFMYGVERVGLATGFKHFGAHDWFREGAADILAREKPNGSWTGGFPDATPLTSTCYALMFLARGRNPIVFNKLQYPGPWNARPQDDAFLTRWMGKRFERPLNWQVVSLDVDPHEWLDAPILLITGSNDPKFTPTDVDKLRTFIESGGMIFSTADDASPAFTEAVKKYASQVVDKRYEMRQLPKSHPLFGKELGVDVQNPPQVLGLSNAVRELWIHSAADLGASWQAQRFANHDLFEMPAGLYFYATGKGAIENRRFSDEQPRPTAPIRETIAMARLIHSTNSDPEPGAWPHLAVQLRSAGIDLQITAVPAAQLDPQKYKIAHITGTGRLVLNPDELTALRKYLDAGGILIADAAGGNAPFTETFLHAIQSLYADAGPVPLPPDNPVYTGKFSQGPETPAADIRLRKYALLTLGKSVTQPAIDGITINGKTRILFSQWDITSGLLGTNTWGIVGYTPKSAQALAANMIRWAPINPRPSNEFS